jgi:LemA protein
MVETIIIGVVILWVVYTYNRLVRNKHLVFEAWSGIDVQLKRRHNLIPKLVDAVKAYSDFESNVLRRVTEIRSHGLESDQVAQRAAEESEISGAVRELFAVVEAYPDLKTSEQFLNLQTNLTEVENQIQLARRYYNGTVREQNVLIQSFPSNLIAGLFKFKESEYFEIALATERQSPKMEF